VAGRFVFIRRGGCPYVTKAENAAHAGAAAYLVYQDDRYGEYDETLINMDCDREPTVCSVPGAFMSRLVYTYVVQEVAWKFFATGTLIFNFSVATEGMTQVGTYQLAPIYPNPVSTTATIGFTLPTAEHARVDVFDLLGRHVGTLADGLRAAGEHTVTLSTIDVPSGVYVVRLATPSTTLTERATVVR
jgi:hypothetical protein